MSNMKNHRKRAPEISASELEFRRLLVFLRDPAFRLGLATYDIPPTREAIIRRATEEAGIRLTTLDLLAVPDDKLLLQRLRDHLAAFAEHERPAGVFVVNMEATFSYASRGADADLSILANANIQRESFEQYCPFPVVLWLTPLAGAAFARHAPDLWHWRTGSFQFSSAFADLTRFQLAMRTGWIAPDANVSAADKQQQLALLNERLERLKHASNRDDPRQKILQADMLNRMGLLHDSLSQRGRGEGYLNKALEIARALGNRVLESGVLGNLARSYLHVGAPSKALELFEQCLTIARETRNQHHEGATLANIGNCYLMLGQPERALEFFEERRLLAWQIGDRRGQASALTNKGVALLHMDQPRQAAEFLSQGLEVFREISEKDGERVALGDLGDAWLTLGDAQRAITFWEKALEASRFLGDRASEGSALANLGTAYLAAGDPRKAIELIEQGLKIARAGENSRDIAIAMGKLGEAQLVTGDLEKAKECFEENSRLAISNGDRLAEINAKANMATALTAAGNTQQAINLLEDVRNYFHDHGDLRRERMACWNLGLAYKAVGDVERGSELMKPQVSYEQRIGHPSAERHAAELDAVSVDLKIGGVIV